jgi:hypothetical protein
MESESPVIKERGSGALATVIVALALPLLYVLSAGPAAWLLDHGYIAGTAVQVAKVAYDPLDWAHDHTFLGEPLDLYLRLGVPNRIY